MNWPLINILLLGSSFMLIFTAFQTTSMLEESVLEAASNSTGQNFSGAGYNSLSIIYLTFALFNFLSPLIVTSLGHKLSLIVCGLVYNLFCATFLRPALWSLYCGSVLLGAAAAVIWTAQGAFLTANSSPELIGRNSGIFWAMFQTSMLWGNLYVFLEFRGEVVIGDADRWKLFLILTIVGCVGSLVMLLFKSNVAATDVGTAASYSEDLGIVNDQDNDDCDDDGVSGGAASTGFAASAYNPLKSIRMSAAQLKKPHTLLLLPVYVYTGLELTFTTGVYGTMLGHTKQFGHSAASMIGLSGLAIASGEIAGGLLFGLLAKYTLRYGRNPVVLTGFIVHALGMYGAYANLPPDAPIRASDAAAPLLPVSEPHLAIGVAFLLGFGDACYNTQVISIVGYLSPGNASAPAFAIFKFFQSAAASAAFFYSTYLLLHWQLLPMLLLGAAASIAFFVCESRFCCDNNDS